MRSVISLMIFIMCFTWSSFCLAEHYEVFTDEFGHIYLKAPDKLVVLPEKKAIPVHLYTPNKYIRLYEVNGKWLVQVLSRAEWEKLQLMSNPDIVEETRLRDFADSGQNSLLLVLRHPTTSQLVISNLTGELDVTSYHFESPALFSRSRSASDYTFSQISAPAIIGLTAGEFRVDESGSATYSIPLSLPAGIAGVQPQLGFSYSSAGGDGYMGVGWSFSGASAITRCPKNLAIDNEQGNVSFSASDRLCLDGQRLVTNGRENDIGVSDSSYWSNSTLLHTEIDNFSTVRKHGTGVQGPLAITVETKAGDVYYYGDISAVANNDAMGNPLSLNIRSADNQHENSADAFFNTAPGVNLARLWALKAIKDSSGNYIVFRYNNDPARGEHYLTEVHYTGRVGGGAPFARVQLNYANNPKRMNGWQSGMRMSMSKLLTSVSVYLDGAADANVVRHYQLNYVTSDVLEEKNHLISIQECADKYLQQCLPATTFDWQKPAAKVTVYQDYCENEPGLPPFCYQQPMAENYVPFATSFELKGSSFDRYNQQLIDIDGDGYIDMLYVRSNQWRVRLGGGQVVYQQRCQSIPGEPTFCWDEPVTTNYNQEITLTNVGINKKDYAQSIDYNGDGRRDLLVANSASENWQIISYTPSTTTGLFCEPEPNGRRLCEPYEIQLNHTVIDTSRRAHGLEGGAFVADINGDGLEDIVYVRDGRFRWYENLGRIVNGSSFSLEQDLGPIADGVSGAFNIYPDNYTAEMKSASILDMNGDGKTDLLIRVYHSVWEPDPRPDCQYQIQSEPSFRTQENQNTQSIGCGSWVTWSSVKLFTSTGSSLIELQDLGNIVDVRAVDLNGDGYTDIMYRSNNRWFYRLSTGRQLLPPRQSNLPTVANNLVGLTYFIDINGDGRTDVLIPTSSSNWNIYLSRPTEMAEQVLFEMRGSRSFDNNAMIQFADINADGKLDLLTSTNDNGWKIFHSLRPHVNEYAINKITNGWGVTTNIEYKNITNKAVYFRDASSNNISSDFFSPRAGMYVVSRVSSEVNPNQFVSIRYQYGGLLLHKKGRGMLGFEVLRTRDEQTNVITETVYNQLWPFTGIPKSTTQVVNVAGVERVLSFAKNTVDRRTTAQGGVFPFISASEEISYQLGTDNQHYTLAKTTSSFSYDSYGNLLSNTVEQSNANSPSQKLTTTTTNSYGSSVVHQRYGRLASSRVTKTQNGQSIVRESDFTYYTAAQGLLLRTERLAPNNPEHRSVTEYQYDAAGNITRRSTTAGTNATGSTTATRFTQSVFDSRMRYLKETSNQLGDKTVYTYNGQSADTVTGRINFINTVDANNQTSRQHFNVLGQNTRNDIKGHSSSDPIVNSYTERQYCSQLSGGCGVTGAYARIRQYADGGGEQLQILDKYGREIATHTRLLTGNWSVTRTTYDAQGRPEYSYEPGIGAASSHFSRVEYDSLGRVHKTHLASGGFTEISYQGFLTVSIDPTGKMQQTLSNYLGQTQRVTDHLGNILDYEYDAYGNLLTVHAQSVAGERSLRTRNTYDAYGRKIRMWDQDKSGTADQNTSGWFYTYNGFGELLSQTDAKAQTTTFEYDSIGRMLRRVEPSGTTCWDYGASTTSYNRGQLTRVRSFNSTAACSSTATPAYQETYTYNSRALPSGKLVSTAGSSFAVSSSYDAFNRLHLLTYPSWTLNPADDVVIRHEYQNGALERLVDHKTNVVYQRVANVNARSQATQVVYGNGVTEDRGFYAASGWLDTSTVKRGANHVHNMKYDYDLVGNVKLRQLSFGDVGSSAGFSEAFDYDDLHRVKSRTITNLGGSTGYAALPAALRMNENYNYDHFGNLTSRSGVGNYCYTATNAAGIRLTNRLTAVGSASNCTGTGAYTFNYDNNGNVTADGKRTFTYTAFDKPSRVTQGANHTDFVYGPNRELYRRTDIRNNQTTDTVYIGGLYERVTKTAGQTEHKFYVGNAVITKRSNAPDNDILYLHKDGQGSTTSITNASGAVVQQFIYDPWGRQYSVNTNSLFTTYSNPGTSKGYTGHNMVNDFEVIHMGGRTYNPILGRFMQADPFVQAPANLQNYNRYSYVLNNPMSYTDPSGYFFIPKAVKKPIRKAFKALGAEFSQLLVAAGSIFCGPAYAACVAYGNYEIARAHGASSTGALRAGAAAGVLAYANGPQGVTGMDLFNAGVSAVNPNAGRVIRFARYGIDMDAFSNSVAEGTKIAVSYAADAYVESKVSAELARFANKNGLSLNEFNALLTIGSFAGNAMVGSRYRGERDGVELIDGMGTRGGKGYESIGIRGFNPLSLPFDAMDYLLGTQGLLTATGHEYVKHGNKTLPLVGYSLGAMDVSNLAALGYAKNAYAFSLPALNVGVRGLGVMNGIWDPVNLGGVGWLFAPHAKWENVGLRCHANYCYPGARGLKWEP